MLQEDRHLPSFMGTRTLLETQLPWRVVQHRTGSMPNSNKVPGTYSLSYLWIKSGKFVNGKTYSKRLQNVLRFYPGPIFFQAIVLYPVNKGKPTKFSECTSQDVLEILSLGPTHYACLFRDSCREATWSLSSSGQQSPSQKTACSKYSVLSGEAVLKSHHFSPCSLSL